MTLPPSRHASLRPALLIIPTIFLLTACGVDPAADRSAATEAERPTSTGVSGDREDPLGSHDPAPGQTLDAALADDEPRPLMQAQVVLDRLGFTPGVIDGKEGLSTRNAISGFQEANALAVTGTLDEATKAALTKWSNIPATRLVTIPAAFAAGPFVKLPEDPEQRSALPALGYESLDEKLAERFHTTVETLRALNPRPTTASGSPAATASGDGDATYFAANQRIRVPNVGADRIEAEAVSDAGWRTTLAALGVGSGQPKASKVVVSKSKETLKVFDASDKLIGMFTATIGSRRDPLPLGKWKVTSIAHNPPFHYNPELLWDVPDSHEKRMLPPGPNGPVGVAWINLDKEHYGIHGTPAPETIGRAQSHGCVRLTNWDVARLAQMVSAGTVVLFEA